MRRGKQIMTDSIASSETPKKWVKIFRRILALFIVSAFVLAYLLFGPHARMLDIMVETVDAETGRPVANGKVEIWADCYHLLNNDQRLFLRSTDKHGRLHFKQKIDYAIAKAGVVVRDQNLTKLGRASNESYFSLSDVLFRILNKTQSNPSKTYVLLSPGRGQYRVEVTSTNEAEAGKYRDPDWYRFRERSARKTRERLADAGIEIALPE